MKLLFLTSVSILFSYGPLNFFAPIPLVFSYLFYGRSKSMAVFFVAIALIGLATFLPSKTYLIAAFCSAYVFAICIAESILRNQHPIRAMVFTGTALVFGLSMILGLFFLVSGKGPSEIVHEFVVQFIEAFKRDNRDLLASNNPEIIPIKELVNNTTLTTQIVLDWIFFFIFLSVFMTLWLSFLVILKNRRLWNHRSSIAYHYGHRHLLFFKTHEYLIYFFIAGLVLYVSDDLVGLPIPKAEMLGWNILVCLSFFYFLQGLGIYLDFLHYLQVYNIAKILFATLMVLIGWKILVVLGIFDLWVNFRNFFKTSKK